MNAHPHSLTREQQDMHSGVKRELPDAIEAEQALLGAILVNNAAIDYIPSQFEPGDFFEPLHRIIFEEARRLHGLGKLANPVTLRSAMPQEPVGDMTVSQYLARLAGNAVSIINVPDYASAISDAAFARAAIRSGEHLIDVGYNWRTETNFIEEIDHIASRVRDRVSTLSMESEGGLTFAQAVDGALDKTANAYRNGNPAGFDCGFPPLSNMIGPLGPGQLIIIGGATKQGKTALTGQIVAGVARSGKPVWFYSGEMSATELAMRQISTVADVPVWRQKRGKVNDHDYETMTTRSSPMRDWNIRVQEKRMTLDQLRRAATGFVKRNGSSLIVVDHIGLIERDRETRRLAEWEFGQEITRALKMLARDLDSPVLACAQLKKNTLSGDGGRLNDAAFFQAVSRKPRYSDLIGACERDADSVIIPFRAEPILQELEPPESSDLHIKWEGMMEQQRNRGEIILALSRENQWPQRREVGWNGPKTMFIDQSETDQGRMF